MRSAETTAECLHCPQAGKKGSHPAYLKPLRLSVWTSRPATAWLSALDNSCTGTTRKCTVGVAALGVMCLLPSAGEGVHSEHG
jgi:hypothetical protein